MMNKTKSTTLRIMNPRVTELKPPIENQEFLIAYRDNQCLFISEEKWKW